MREVYAPVELASVAKDIEGLRTSVHRLEQGTDNRAGRQTHLRNIDGYARILSDATDVLARYDSVEQKRLGGLPASIRARHQRFMNRVLPVVRGLTAQLGKLAHAEGPNKSAAIPAIDAQLARIAPPPERPVRSSVPVHAVHFQPRAPRHLAEVLRQMPNAMAPEKFDANEQLLHKLGGGGGRGIFPLPGFLIALLAGPGPADLAATDETPLSADIVAKANALGKNPVAIFNFVHDQIVTEVYYGSKKGARGTLAEMAGNDIDQASLLIALLRASGIPARYEMGTVVLTPEQAMGFTGTETAAAAASALVSTGYPALQIANGSTVTGVQMELVWVRAFVPYANYRGVDLTGKGEGSIWVHLAPSVKRYQKVSAVDLSGKVPFDFDGYLTKDEPKSPVDTWQDQLRAYVQSNGLDCATLDGAEKARIPIADHLPVLPEALPVQVSERLAVFSAVPASLQQSVEIAARSSSGSTLFDYQSTIAALYGQPLSVQYEPATDADAATIAAHGGLESTPAYLVQLRPVLYSSDQPLASGAAGETPGLDEDLEVHLTIPALGDDSPAHHALTVGGVYALVTDPGTLPSRLGPPGTLKRDRDWSDCDKRPKISSGGCRDWVRPLL